LDPIAKTGREFRDFAPYVPAMSPGGVVYFQATLAGGATAVFGGSEVLLRSGTHGIAVVRSHPDVDARGRWCAYVDLDDGREAVVLGDGASVRHVAITGDELTHIGPLGPTMSDEGAIAFRASTARGEGVFLAYDDRLVALDVGRAFHGLPIVRADRSVVVRADDAICALREGAPTETIVSGLAELGPFVSANNQGDIAFRAAAGVFVCARGAVRPIVSGFESHRGALINDRGTIVFYATPVGGSLGVYVARGQRIERIVALGDGLRGLALNPVSLNDRDELAVRLESDDGQSIVRFTL
jgi:hypothetical protein